MSYTQPTWCGRVAVRRHWLMIVLDEQTIQSGVELWMVSRRVHNQVTYFGFSAPEITGVPSDGRSLLFQRFDTSHGIKPPLVEVQSVAAPRRQSPTPVQADHRSWLLLTACQVSESNLCTSNEIWETAPPGFGTSCLRSVAMVICPWPFHDRISGRPNDTARDETFPKTLLSIVHVKIVTSPCDVHASLDICSRRNPNFPTELGTRESQNAWSVQLTIERYAD